MDSPIVITGLGCVSALGVGRGPLWDGMCEGRSGLGPITLLDPSGFPMRLAGQAPDFTARDYVPKSYRKAVKVMARDIEMAVVAARLAATDAGLVTRESEGEPTYPSEAMGCHIGAGLISTEADELVSALVTARDAAGNWDIREWGRAGLSNLQPLWLLKYLPNMLACHVTILHGCTGPSNTVTCGEASGLLSLGESARVIERGNAEACFSGSAESRITHMGLSRMGNTRRLAPTGELREGVGLVRPYDPDAPGQVIGEAGAILILERPERARARGTRTIAEIVGFGAAHSPGALSRVMLDDPASEVAEDEGLVDAIEAALDDASVKASSIDAIVPHGAGVGPIDRAEAGALARVFGSRIGEVPLVTWGPNLGECMAGNGGVQAALGAMCLESQRLPARVHAGRPRGDMLAGQSASRDATLRHVLVCSGSIGGSSAAIVLRRAS
ncbi:MAG: hypothetical protein H6811_08060 [Phycisphaeraceae bacterium]|nr:hypothetical protein [Phycisphaeraceae bacterium]